MKPKKHPNVHPGAMRMENTDGSKSLGAIFLGLTEMLSAKQIPHCVLGDTRNVPDDIESDVDIVVPRAYLNDLPALLAGYCSQAGVELVQAIQHESQAWYFAMAWFDPAGRVQILNPDICGDYMPNGLLFMKAEELLENRMQATDKEEHLKGFQVPAPAIAFTYYLVKRVEKLSIQNRHGDYLHEQWKLNSQSASALVRRFWPPEDAALIEAASRTNSWFEVRRRLDPLRRQLRKGRHRSVGLILQELARKGRRVIQPTGFMVAVLGPDGSGKSSAIDAMLSDLKPAFRRTTRLHLRPHLGRAQPGQFETVSDPHGKAPRGLLAGTLKLLYLWLDHSLGYWFKVRPLLVHSNLVVFDRYYHDLLVDPQRYRFAKPLWLARLIGHLIPQPDVWLLLDAPAEVLQQRKQEVSVEETSRQLGAYRKLADQLSSCRTIDAAAPMIEVAAECNKAVLGHLVQRQARRQEENHHDKWKCKQTDLEA